MAIDPFITGSLISAGASIWGASKSAKAAKRANAATIENARLDRELQEDFAQKGIRWRVNDAQKAGIHPLYAMGASIPGYNPSPISLSSGTSLGPGLASAGQDIGRAVTATMTKGERNASWETAILKERGLLENELLRANIAKEKAQLGPPLPSALTNTLIPGQGDASLAVNPMPVNPSAPGRPHHETAAVSDTGFARTSTGLAPTPSLDVKERIEDQIVPEMSWALRNNIIPFFDPQIMNQPGRKPNPTQFPTKPGYKWHWMTKWQEYRQVPIGSDTLSKQPTPYRDPFAGFVGG